MRNRLAVLLVAALALTGCTAGAGSAPEATSAPTVSTEAAPVVATPEPTPTAKPKPTADPAQAWADDMINLFLNGTGKSTFDDFGKEYAHRYIQSWETSKPGVLALTVSGKWTTEDLDLLAFTVMQTAGWETPELTQVNVLTQGGGTSGNAVRSDVQGMK